jgi:hypothetical protein
MVRPIKSIIVNGVYRVKSRASSKAWRFWHSNVNDIYRIPNSVSANEKDGYLHLPALLLTLWGEQRQQQADWIN